MESNIIKEIEELSQKRKNEILNSCDSISVKGTAYYVSNCGDDDNDGKTPETAWKTLKKVSEFELQADDAVLFRRGDTFRGFVKTVSGVTYCAYGEGEKPKFYGWEKDLAEFDLWTLYDEKNNIWKFNEKILDCGTLVFNGGEKHSYKHIPSYYDGQFVCRDNKSKPFIIENELKGELDIVCLYDERLTEMSSKGQNFPIPVVDSQSFGDLYLRCENGNPGECFNSIEAVPKRAIFGVGTNSNVTIDNLCIKYGCFAVSANGTTAENGMCVEGLTVSNCEIGWIGGNIQHYLGTDPNYPQGERGSVTRYGNGIEIYGGCKNYKVLNCYIYQSYDAGITHQISTFGKDYKLEDIQYKNNLIEYCVYSIEYFLEKNNGDTQSYIKNCEIGNNIMRFCGYGWGQQRHNKETPAHIKGWDYENTAYNFSIYNNIFDRGAYRLIHIGAEDKESCPVMMGNTYIQKRNMPIGQYGINSTKESNNIVCDDKADEIICTKLNEKDYQVHVID